MDDGNCMVQYMFARIIMSKKQEDLFNYPGGFKVTCSCIALFNVPTYDQVPMLDQL